MTVPTWLSQRVSYLIPNSTDWKVKLAEGEYSKADEH
jgi:hypothetical protein